MRLLLKPKLFYLVVVVAYHIILPLLASILLPLFLPLVLPEFILKNYLGSF